MARGWESKSVEEQQSQAQQPSSAAAPPKDEAERRRAQEQESLRLARARIQQQLAAAKDERYAAQLRAALHEIEGKLSR